MIDFYSKSNRRSQYLYLAGTLIWLGGFVPTNNPIFELYKPIIILYSSIILLVVGRCLLKDDDDYHQ